MWDEEGGDGEDRVVLSEPDLVGPIPGQGVQVFHEHQTGSQKLFFGISKKAGQFYVTF